MHLIEWWVVNRTIRPNGECLTTEATIGGAVLDSPGDVWLYTRGPSELSTVIYGILTRSCVKKKTISLDLILIWAMPLELKHWLLIYTKITVREFFYIKKNLISTVNVKLTDRERKINIMWRQTDLSLCRKFQFRFLCKKKIYMVNMK